MVPRHQHDEDERGRPPDGAAGAAARFGRDLLDVELGSVGKVLDETVMDYFYKGTIDQKEGLPLETSQVAPTGVGPVTVLTSILPLLRSESGVAFVTVLT